MKCFMTGETITAAGHQVLLAQRSGAVTYAHVHVSWITGTQPQAVTARPCPAATGPESAACFCRNVTSAGGAFKYYADVQQGCTGAMWCSAPGQSAYVPCPAGMLFSEPAQTCDWPANVRCNSRTVTSKYALGSAAVPKQCAPIAELLGLCKWLNRIMWLGKLTWVLRLTTVQFHHSQQLTLH